MHSCHSKDSSPQWSPERTKRILTFVSSKTRRDNLERQGPRWHRLVTHSLTTLETMSPTNVNTSLQQRQQGFPVIGSHIQSIGDHSTHRPTHSPRLGLLGQIPSEKVKEKVSSPARLPTFQYCTTTHLIINTTLAGVAQSVERVALITAKRSTSRSWVRAPPSAIPISKLIRAAVLLLFVCSVSLASYQGP